MRGSLQSIWNCGDSEEEFYCPICDNEEDNCEHSESEIENYILDWKCSLIEDERESQIEQEINDPYNWGEE